MKKSISSIMPVAVVFVISSANLFAQKDDNLITESTETLNEEGVSSAQSGNYQRAIKRFQKAVAQQDQDVAITYNNLAYTYYLAGDMENAIVNYKQAIIRNPNLIPSLANLGKILYDQENFSEAVEYGEKVMKLDPGNEEVRKWLPEAYRKAAEKRMMEFSNENSVAEEEKPGLDSPVRGQATAKRPNSVVELNTMPEFLIGKSPLSFTYFTPGGLVQVPFNLNADLWTSETLQFKVALDNPSFGIPFPFYTVAEEHLDFIFHTEKMAYGVGIHFAQANFINDTFLDSGGFIANGAFPERTDIKLGGTLGIKDEFSLFTVSVFPRFLFQDAATGPQSIEFDRSVTKVEYTFFVPEQPERKILPSHLEFMLALHVNETYITEYLVPTLGAFSPVLNTYFDLTGVNPSAGTYSHYMGTYDLFFDVQFGKITKKFNTIPFVFGVRVGAKLFYADIYNDKPFTFGNGQGFFGLDTQSALSGNAFPTMIGSVTYARLYFKQMFFNRLILQETLGTDFASTELRYHLLSLGLKLSFIF